MGEVRTWTTAPCLALASAALFAGCGGDPEADADPTSLRSPGEYDCALAPEKIGEITGFDFVGVEPDGGGIGGTRVPLAWQGCRYTSNGDATVEVSVIVDGSGEPDVAPYDALVADAESAGGDTGTNDPVLVDGVGDSAVHYRDSIYFKVGATAYVVSGEDDEDDPLGRALLEEIARAVVAGG